MNALAIGLGLFLLFIFSMPSNVSSFHSFLGYVSAISLILVGLKFINKRYANIPFYLSLVSLVSFSILYFYEYRFEYFLDWEMTQYYFYFSVPVGFLIYYHRPKKIISNVITWSWVEGKVDTKAACLELRYGSVESGGYYDWLPIAYISPPHDHVFTVDFLIQDSDEENKKAIETAKRELNFYLVDKKEPLRCL